LVNLKTGKTVGKRNEDQVLRSPPPPWSTSLRCIPWSPSAVARAGLHCRRHCKWG